jgi:hypothetical protein
MWSVEAGRFEPGKAKVAVVPRSAGHAPPVSEPTTPKRIEREIVLRPQQARFRAGLLERYNGACCLSGCTAQDALDAAHIYPYSAKHLDHVSNGLLLRRDLHGLFDAGKLAFDPKTLEACFAPDVRDCYRALHGKRMSLPDDPEARPAPQALAARWALYQRDSG